MASTNLTLKTAGNGQSGCSQPTESVGFPPAHTLEGARTSPFRLIVKEYIPKFINHLAPAKTAIVDRLDQVLAVPWISKMPGEKQLTYSRGQRVVVQHYLGYHLVRAHVHWDFKPSR